MLHFQISIMKQKQPVQLTMVFSNLCDRLLMMNLSYIPSNVNLKSCYGISYMKQYLYFCSQGKVYKDRKAQGITPYLPSIEEREKIKNDYMKYIKDQL